MDSGTCVGEGRCRCRDENMHVTPSASAPQPRTALAGGAAPPPRLPCDWRLWLAGLTTCCVCWFMHVADRKPPLVGARCGFRGNGGGWAEAISRLFLVFGGKRECITNSLLPCHHTHTSLSSRREAVLRTATACCLKYPLHIRWDGVMPLSRCERAGAGRGVYSREDEREHDQGRSRESRIT